MLISDEMKTNVSSPPASSGGNGRLILAPPAGPTSSRSYTIATFGTADTVLVLFEQTSAGLKYLAGDDDSGTDRNAQITVKLLQGRTYVARLRLYYAGASGATAIMYF